MKTRSATALALLAGFAIGGIAVHGLHAAGRAPAYVVTEIGISDLDAYQKEYLPLAQASIKAAGGHLIAAGQNITVFEGPSPGTRVAINQFDSLDAAQAWRSSRKRVSSAISTRSSVLSLLRAFLNNQISGRSEPAPGALDSSLTTSSLLVGPWDDSETGGGFGS
jgi:uncharacterized protein (DUF1330 family)